MERSRGASTRQATSVGAAPEYGEVRFPEKVSDVMAVRVLTGGGWSICGQNCQVGLLFLIHFFASRDGCSTRVVTGVTWR